MNIRVISIYMIAIFGVTVANLSTAYGQQEKTEPVIRLVQTDPILGKQYHKQQYEIRDGKICPIDIYGNREYHKPCFTITTSSKYNLYEK